VRDERSDALKVTKVDLAAALLYEKQALALDKQGNEHAAHEELIHGYGAVWDALKALRLFEPDAWEARQYRKLHHTDDPWHVVDTELRDAINDDHGALEYRAFAGNVVLAYAHKLKAFAAVDAAFADPCTEVTNLRGPITVNGVPQGASQLTVIISCQEPMKEIDLDLHGQAWTDVQVSKGVARVLEGGEVLAIDLSGVTYVSVTAEGKPDFVDGDKIEGDIIPIHGDSHPPIDEVM
jgi:hypothetical protein